LRRRIPTLRGRELEELHRVGVGEIAVVTAENFVADATLANEQFVGADHDGLGHVADEVAAEVAERRHD